jgi:hypothetical protein
MQHMRCLLLYFVIGLVIIGFTACGSSTSNTGTIVASTSTPLAGNTPTSTPTPVGHFKAGQTVNVGDTWQITITNVSTGHGNYAKPQKAGDVFLIIEISAKNISTTEKYINDANFTLRDLNGVTYSAGFDDNATNFLGGKVEANSPLKGSAVFEIPTAIHAYILLFEVSMFQTGQTIWDIQV